MPEASVDSIVTDPPYELGFMGKSWDASGIAFNVEVWREALRVLKPGGHLLAFSGSRTYHRMVVAIEDAGFEIRDQIMWLYGSGFPKSHNLQGEWQGWGTALKPAHEPIVVARKPLIGTVAANVLAHGTGALNIDGCRTEGAPRNPGFVAPTESNRDMMSTSNAKLVGYVSPEGRWPANVIHDGSDEVLAAFPNAPGQMADASTSDTQRAGKNVYGDMKRGSNSAKPRGDAGSAARFFYCAKASKADRNAGCEGLPQQVGGMVSNTSGQHITRRDEGYTPKPQANNHPTVKPTELMRYLCRLVTPPDGLVLDPFTGSGSTGKAAALEGFRFIGCELSPEYFAIATKRLEDAYFGDLL